ncbi:MAG: alpha/beta hydrolase [Roseobacter sp.]|jgi:esterase/lipase superfamily enzyme
MRNVKRFFVPFHRINPPLCALLIVGLLVACSRPPELIGVDNPEVPVLSVADATRHKIFLATTRKGSETVGALYSAERAPELGLASVTVSVPPTHVTGQLERPKRLPPDPRSEFAIVEPTIYANDNAFIRHVNDELAKLPPGRRDILFFVHGYNNTTSDAVLRLAQFVEDTQFDGVPILFDWASAASLSRYVYDLNSALIARPKVEQLVQILGRTTADNYNIFAHSMGSLLVMETSVLLARANSLNRLGRLRTVVLASPDIDMDLFRIQLDEIGYVPDRFYVLLSKDDEALRFSRRVAGGVPRVGAANADELAALGVVAIDLSEINDSSSGSHSKFAGSPEVVRLIGRGLNDHSNLDRNERANQLEGFLQGIPIRISF